MANSDALILLDCCSSGVSHDSEGNGITELICACPYDTEANGVGHYSFTQALTKELQFLSKKPCFSAGDLYNSIYRRLQSYLPQGVDNERYPPPVHFVLTQDENGGRGIKLSALRSKVPQQGEIQKGRLKRVVSKTPRMWRNLEVMSYLIHLTSVCDWETVQIREWTHLSGHG
jgi:hypothetical protein